MSAKETETSGKKLLPINGMNPSWRVTEETIDFLNRLQIGDPAVFKVGPTLSQIQALDLASFRHSKQSHEKTKDEETALPFGTKDGKSSMTEQPQRKIPNRQRKRYQSETSKKAREVNIMGYKARARSTRGKQKMKDQSGNSTSKKTSGTQPTQREKEEKHAPGPEGDSSVNLHSVKKSRTEFRALADPSGGGELIFKEKRGHLDCTIVYSREFLIQCAESPHAWIAPPSAPVFSLHLTEVQRKIPGRFRGKVYKEFCNCLHKPDTK